MRFTRGIGWAAALLALAVAVALFTRFSFDDTMRRDEAIFGFSFAGYSHARSRDTGLLRERDRAVAVERLLNPGEHFEAFGDPLSLVLTGTRDPTRFVYLSEGVGDWAVRHEFGGFEGFAASRSSAPGTSRAGFRQDVSHGRGVREHPLRVDARVDGP
jgi:hypothetical protein